MRRESLLKEMIAGARDVDHAATLCRRLALDLGFEHFLYGLRLAITLSQPSQVVISGYPKA